MAGEPLTVARASGVRLAGSGVSPLCPAFRGAAPGRLPAPGGAHDDKEKMVAADPRAARGAPAPTGTVRFAWRGRDVTRPLPIDDEQAETFARWLEVLQATGVPYALGGAYVT